jgi:F0F1-type ATP synthase assembly protein I
MEKFFCRHAFTLIEEKINMEFFWMILIGMIAGWLAGQFMTGKGFGVIGDIIVGMCSAR